MSEAAVSVLKDLSDLSDEDAAWVTAAAIGQLAHRLGTGPALETVRRVVSKLENPVLDEHSMLGCVTRVLAEYPDITLDMLKSTSLDRSVVRARWHAFWLCRQVKTRDGKHRHSMQQIGNFFRKDHSTVVNGAREYEKILRESA